MAMPAASPLAASTALNPLSPSPPGKGFASVRPTGKLERPDQEGGREGQGTWNDSATTNRNSRKPLFLSLFPLQPIAKAVTRRLGQEQAYRKAALNPFFFSPPLIPLATREPITERVGSFPSWIRAVGRISGERPFWNGGRNMAEGDGGAW